MLIDATYAGLLSGATDAPLVIPALNRDGDCLSDLVLPMFGSIAGAESVLLAFDESYDTTVAMAEAPHGTAPALEGKDLANPLAMILACGPLLRHAADRHGAAAERASRAIYEAALETVGAGIKTPDLGGHAGTTEFTAAVVERVATKLEVWSSLGSRLSGSVRAPFYAYEHMFQSSARRLRARLSRFEDILGDPPADARPTFDSAREGAPYSRPAPHPHRQPLRWERRRASGKRCGRSDDLHQPGPRRPRRARLAQAQQPAPGKGADRRRAARRASIARGSPERGPSRDSQPTGARRDRTGAQRVTGPRPRQCPWHFRLEKNR